MSQPSELFMRITDGGKLFVAAQHQDQINSWKWWQRWLHRKFIARRCPACIYWNAK